MITTDGNTWDPVSSFGLDYNWNIQFFALDQSDGKVLPKINDMTYHNSNDNLSSGETNLLPTIVMGDDTRDISGFNIYRMTDYETEYQLYDMVEFVNGQTEYCYQDDVVDFGTGYFYKVTANYISETDECESSPAMAYEIPEDDYVYIWPESVEENTDKGNIIVFPNPARDEVNISSTTAIESIRITNYMGQIVYTNNAGHSTSIKLNTSTYPEGVYLIQVETKFGITTKRVIINR